VQIGDDTGVVNAFLYRTEVITEGASLVIFKAEAKVVKERIEVQLMERGKVDESRREVKDVDTKTNISERSWVEEQ